MKLALIHNRYPYADGPGSTQEANQIVDLLSNSEHDLTVFCGKTPPKDVARTYDFDIELLGVDSGYIRNIGKTTKLNSAIVNHVARFNDFDVVHCMISRSIPAMAVVGKRSSASTLVGLNGYGPVCPKRHPKYKNKEICKKNGPLRCTNCIIHSQIEKEGDRMNNKSFHPALQAARRFPAVSYGTLHQFESVANIQRIQQSLHQIDQFHAVSEHMASTFSSFGFPPDKIDVFPNIVDEAFICESTSTFVPPFKILYVGSLIDKKGVDKLVPILDYVQERSGKEYELTIVGSGDRQAHIEDQVEARNLQTAVDVKGFISKQELIQLYAEHDLFLYPGIWDEPFGRVFLEAMAAGTPIVASNVGDVETIIGGGGVVAPGTIEELGEQVLEVSDEQILQEMSEEAKSRTTEYTANHVYPKLEKIYNELVK